MVPMEFADFMSRGEADLKDRVADFLIEIGLQDGDPLPGTECDRIGHYRADEGVVIDIEE